MFSGNVLNVYSGRCLFVYQLNSEKYVKRCFHFNIDNFYMEKIFIFIY